MRHLRLKFCVFSMACTHACSLTVGDRAEETASDKTTFSSQSPVLSANSNAIDESPSETPPVPVTNTLSNYRVVGRSLATNANLIMFSFPGTKIGANFTGTRLSAMLSSTAYDYLDVVVDGNRYVADPNRSTGGCVSVTTLPAELSGQPYRPCIALTPSAGPETHAIATNLSAGNHSVWMVKRTEFYQGSGTLAVGAVSFGGFLLDADATLLSGPKPQKRRVDFIGDSGFAGYGAGQVMHGASDACGYSPLVGDGGATVPAYVADMLNADGLNVSSSGQGIVNGYYDDNPNHLLPVIYDAIVPFTSSVGHDFTAAPPDVLVIQGGGDDLIGAAGSGHFKDPDAFVSGYTIWLEKLRGRMPNVQIVCAVTAGASGDDIATMTQALKQVVAERQARGDMKVSFFSFFGEDPNFSTYSDIATKCGFYWGCRYHPSPAGARWLAKRLAGHLRTLMGWND